jgi:hypothetical protein
MKCQTRLAEKLLLRAEEPPFSYIYRMVIGFVLPPLLFLVHGRSSSAWALVLFLVCVLMALRIIPAIVRHVFPFSAEIQELWKERRQLAKRYDSYQWRKLFWIGVGLGISMGFSRNLRGSELLVGLACLVGGGLGMVVWRRRSRMIGF